MTSLDGMSDINDKLARTLGMQLCELLWEKKADISYIRNVLQAGCNLTVRKHKMTALQIASMKNYAEAVTLILQYDPAGVNLQSDEGYSALINAGGHMPVSKILIEAGADVDLQNKYGYMPLFSAMDGKSIEAVKLILDHSKKDIDTAYNSGHTALIHAAKKSDIEILALLISRGANPLLKNNDGMTARDCAGDNNAPKSWADKDEQLVHQTHLDAIRDLLFKAEEDYQKKILAGAVTQPQAVAASRPALRKKRPAP